MADVDARDFDWDLKAVLQHHAADVLREVALAIGSPAWESISRGEVAAYLQGRAQNLDGCTARNAFGDGDLVCREHGPHPTHVFAGSPGDTTSEPTDHKGHR